MMINDFGRLVIIITIIDGTFSFFVSCLTNSRRENDKRTQDRMAKGQQRMAMAICQLSAAQKGDFLHD